VIYLHKLITILAFILLLVTSVSAQEKLLTAVDVIQGEYAEYKALKGYEHENLYQIYFKGNSESYQVTFDKYKKVNMDEVITWKYKDKVIKTKRSELYKFFSDLSYFSSRLAIDDKSIFTPNWFQETFGEVYQDWVDDGVYANEANSLVIQYFKQDDSSKSRYSLSE
jgi:hypothetical protein